MGNFHFKWKVVFFYSKIEYILLYDCVPTFNCLLQQYIPENRTAGSQRDFTGSKILCNVKLCRLATFPRHLLNIQRKDIQLENTLSSSY